MRRPLLWKHKTQLPIPLANHALLKTWPNAVIVSLSKHQASPNLFIKVGEAADFQSSSWKATGWWPVLALALLFLHWSLSG